MPELPEVETVKRALAPHLLDRRICDIRTFSPTLRTPLAIAGHSDLIGQVIVDIRRRAKYMIWELQNCHALMFHLGMTGSFRIEAGPFDRQKHDHILIALDNHTTVCFNDPRRFGQAEHHVLPRAGAEPECLSGLAPEPLSDDFDLRWFRKICRDRQRPIKNLIMDNSCVVGVGNIYASEALFRAGIRPTAPAGGLSAARRRRLHASIRAVLADAIEAGGTTIINFQTVDGSEGRFRCHLDVYGKARERCGSCHRGIIRHTVMAGRSTFFCPICQR